MEDYKKLYEQSQERHKKTIERAISWAKGEHPECFSEAQKAIEFIFPELRESEDEKVRKSLIDYFSNFHLQTFAGLDPKKILAWLEKQGEHANFRNKIQIGDKVTRNEAGILVNISQLNRIAKPRVAIPTEKQGPKFHEGDFIKHNKANIICKVISVNSGSYYVENIGTSGRIELFNAEQNFHLWTIKDAKPGDVLIASDGSLFIFAKVKDNYAYYHFSLCKNGSKEISDGKHAWETANSCYPATKEQRDTLLKAMADAGCEWDSEKKELKEIDPKPYGQRKECLDCQFNYVGERKGSCQMKREEQKVPVVDFKAKDWYVSKVDGKIHNIYNSVDKVEPKFHEGDIIQFNGFGHNRYTIKNVCGLSHYINTIGEKMDMSYTDANFEVIKDSDKNKLCRAWSEEDEDAIGMAIIALEDMYDEDAPNTTYGGYNLPFNKAAERLKSLKYRVQPKQEWSKEDIRNIQDIDSVLFYDKDLPEDTCMRLRNWLKSLKPNKDMVEALRTEYEKGRADVISEMKSSWSEEDETNSYQLKTLFENLAKDIKHEFRIISDNDRDKYTAWLKSLKDRVIPQPKQEWSEEDEKERKRIIGLLEGWLSTFKETCYAEDCKCGIDWLKSLKDRIQPQKQ